MGLYEDCYPHQHSKEEPWEQGTMSATTAWADGFQLGSQGRWGPLNTRWGTGCSRKFTPGLLVNSSSLSSLHRKDFIPIVNNILKNLCQVDFSRTDPEIKQCSRWKEKVHHLTWIFPPSIDLQSTASLISKCPICSAFLSNWSCYWNWSRHEAGKIVKFISLNLSLVLLEDVT